MRERIERVLRWVSVVFGTLIIGSCTVAGAMDSLSTALLGLLGGTFLTMLLLGWLFGYLLLRKDIASLQDALSALERRQSRADEGEGTAEGPSESPPPTTSGTDARRINRRWAAVLLASAASTTAVVLWHRSAPPAPPPPPSVPPVSMDPFPYPPGSVDERIAKVVAEQLGVPVANVRPDSTLGGLKADSLDLVELVMALENEYGIEIPDDVIEHQCASSVTVQQIVAYISQRLSERRPPR